MANTEKGIMKEILSKIWETARESVEEGIEAPLLMIRTKEGENIFLGFEAMSDEEQKREVMFKAGLGAASLEPVFVIFIASAWMTKTYVPGRLPSEDPDKEETLVMFWQERGKELQVKYQPYTRVGDNIFWDEVMGGEGRGRSILLENFWAGVNAGIESPKASEEARKDWRSFERERDSTLDS